MPLAVFSSASVFLTMTRSARGFSFISLSPLSMGGDAHPTLFATLRLSFCLNSTRLISAFSRFPHAFGQINQQLAGVGHIDAKRLANSLLALVKSFTVVRKEITDAGKVRDERFRIADNVENLLELVLKVLNIFL